MPVVIHPPSVGFGEERMRDYRLASSIGRPMDGALAIARLIVRGVFEKFPKLKLVGTHLGGGICEMIGRMNYAYRLQDEAFFLGSYEPMLIKHEPLHYLKMMYLESTCYHAPGARCAIDTVGVDHFLFGTDSPPLFVLKQEGVDLINKLGLSPEDEEQGLLREREEALEALTREDRDGMRGPSLAPLPASRPRSCVVAASRCGGRRLFQGQGHHDLCRLDRRRSLRRLCADARAPLGPQHPRQSEYRRAEHAGRQRPPADGPHAGHRAQGRHRDRRRASRAAVRSADGREGQVRSAPRSTWIGNANDEVNICVVWHASPIKTFDDLRTHEMVVGSGGPASTDTIYPNLLNALFGTKFRVVGGYEAAAQTHIAMERGEVDGRCGMTWDTLQAIKPEWITDKKVRILVQVALEKHPDMPNVPSVFDLARNEEERQIAGAVGGAQQDGPAVLCADRAAEGPRGAAAPQLRPHHEGSCAAGRGRKDEGVRIAYDRRRDRCADRTDLCHAQGRGRQGARSQQRRKVDSTLPLIKERRS